MPKICAICKRGAATGNKRSHSMIATRRQFQINLQTKKIDGKRAKVCSSCLKTMSKSN